MSYFDHFPKRFITLAALGLVLTASAAMAEPDLKVSSLSVTPAIADIQTPMQVQIGLRNDGTTAVTGAIFELRAGKISASPTPQPLLVQLSNKVNLAPGQAMSISTSLSLGLGDHLVTATIDPGRLIPDTDRTNNGREQKVTVTPIELSREDLARLREMLPVLMPHGKPAGPFMIYEMVSSDLYPGFHGVYSLSKSGHVGVRLDNAGPDKVPLAALEAVGLKVEFTGAPSDKSCTISLKGKVTGDLAAKSSLGFDFYTQSNAPCPRAKVVSDTCDPAAHAKGLLTFTCLLVPELRYEVILPTAQDLTGSGLILVDPKPYNNVEIVPAGRY